MTTTIEKKIYGVRAGTQSITDKEVAYVTNPITDHSITIEDVGYSSRTIVCEQRASLQELLERLLAYQEYPIWDLIKEKSLKLGESTVIGPVWCRLKITRES